MIQKIKTSIILPEQSHFNESIQSVVSIFMFFRTTVPFPRHGSIQFGKSPLDFRSWVRRLLNCSSCLCLATGVSTLYLNGDPKQTMRLSWGTLWKKLGSWMEVPGVLSSARWFGNRSGRVGNAHINETLGLLCTTACHAQASSFLGFQTKPF